MALEGNVKDFGLSEILQLIALQKKTGMLSITGERTMVIYFREGLVISTRDRRSDAEDPLKDFLLRYGFLNVRDVARIERILTDTELDLTDILVSEKLISPAELRSIFSEQIQETIQEILSWPKSQYKFIIGSQVLSGVRSFASLKVEGLLMESMRRIDEFPEMLRIFPSEATILQRLPLPEKNPPSLDVQEKAVYKILTEGQCLGEVVSKARMARFSVYETLKCLLEKGLLQITEVEESEKDETPFEVEERTRPTMSRLVPLASVLAILVACFALGEFVLPFVLKPGWRVVHPSRGQANAPSSVSAESLVGISMRQLDSALREALEEHLALRGSYPATLEALASKGLLPRTVLRKAIETGIDYRLSEGRQAYTLGPERP
jgi:hypothetical protein